MRAVLLKGFGGAEMLRVGETDRPSVGPGQVLIRVIASSVNRADITQRQGNYPAPPGESEILGLEVAGLIVQLGEGVGEGADGGAGAGWKLGDRVMCLVGGGGYAEYAAAYPEHLIAIPETMSFEEAACVCETYITAFLNIFLIGRFEDGRTVLLHGGGGGVNTAAIQLCRLLTPDARILVTASPRKLERVEALGAHRAIDYTSQDFAFAVGELTGGQGADLILDHIGAKYLTGNMKALALGGSLVIIGVMGGIKAELNLVRMMVKRQRIIGSVLRARPVDEKARIVAEFTQAVMPRLADRTIEPLIHEVFPLDKVSEAHETMEQSRHFGKIVLAVAR
jgi:putative PIG3 family NAD(P)H quinone oxidoreductase